MRVALVSLVAVLVAGCSNDVRETDESAESGEDAIIGGRVTFVEPAVGVTTLDGGTGCSATLVRANVIILAGHCPGPDRTDIAPWAFQIRKSASEVYTFATAPDGWVKGRHTGSDDLALVRLAEPVPPEIAKPIALATRWPSWGTRLRMIGFGCIERGGPGQGVKRMAEYIYGPSWDAGLRSRRSCPGDSGGALIDTSTHTLLGVISGWNTVGFDNYGDVIGHRGELEREIARLER